MTDQEKMKQSVIFWTTLLAQKEQPEQEPVAWMSQAGNFLSPLEFTTADAALYGWTPVYTAPPQRKPLTEKQIEPIAIDVLGYAALCKEEMKLFTQSVRAVEAAHGIKENSHD